MKRREPSHAKKGCAMASRITATFPAGHQGPLDWVHLSQPAHEELARELPGCQLPLLQGDERRAVFIRLPDGYFLRFYCWSPDAPYHRPPALSVVVSSRKVVSWSATTDNAIAVRLYRRLTNYRYFVQSPEHLAFMMFDETLETAFSALDRLNDRLADLEQEVFRITDKPAELRQRLFRVKREIIGFRHVMASERDLAYQLARFWAGFDTFDNGYAFELYDHAIRLFDMVDGYRELVTSVLDLHLAANANRVNEIVQKLTVMAAIFLPASVIAALYGMNLRFLPGADLPGGFYLIVGGITVISGSLLFLFRRLDWV